MTTAIQQSMEAEINKIDLEIQILKAKQKLLQDELRKHVRQYQIMARLGDMTPAEVAAIVKLADVATVEGENGI